MQQRRSCGYQSRHTFLLERQQRRSGRDRQNLGTHPPNRDKRCRVASHSRIDIRADSKHEISGVAVGTWVTNSTTDVTSINLLP
jgi:hypothetical protein